MCVVQIKGLLTNGTGVFDEEQVKHAWPQALGLSDKTVGRTMTELAGKRKNDMLVQGVAALRTKRFDDTVKALNNVMACNKVGVCGRPSFLRCRMVVCEGECALTAVPHLRLG